MTVAIATTCTACGNCVVTCPERALVRAPKRPVLIASRCTSCLACVEVCPVDAIREVDMSERSERIISTGFLRRLGAERLTGPTCIRINRSGQAIEMVDQ